jgi:thiol-disulfide isomerase/thioredoxin
MSQLLHHSGVIRGCVCLSIAFFSAWGARADDALPRYRLQPGQELSYSGGADFKYEGGKLLSRQSWKIWVVRENPDGGWRLILRHGSRFAQVRNDASKKPNEEGAEDADAKALSDDPEDVTFAWCDLHPDGTIEENDSFGFRMHPAALFPRLPVTAAEAADGWKSRIASQDETDHYRLSPAPTDRQYVFEIVRQSPMYEIYGNESRRMVTFDRDRGIPEKIAMSDRQTYGFNGKSEGTVNFIGERTHPGEWLRQFTEDAERYLAVQSAFQKTTRRKDLSATELKAALDEALQNVKRASEEMQSAELKKLLEDQSAQREQSAHYAIESLEERAKLLGTPSEDWSTTDLAGTTHALKDYRGKVVVLDFWYRGCGWCIRAMPQVKEVAAHFAEKPVVVFGMNTDQKEDDAQFVIEKMGLTYPNLKATGLPEKNKVTGFPTLLILDQEGVIRDIHVGYSPTLREEVIQSVERLLKQSSQQ